MTITARTGETNAVLIEPLNTGVFRVTDYGARLSATAPCTQITPNRVTCSSAGITLVRVLAGDGDDEVTHKGSTRAELRGGAGNDDLHGGTADDTLAAGAGGFVTGFSTEQLNGNGGADTLIGSTTPGVAAILDGGSGVDTLRGGLSNDTLVGGDGPDGMSGGGGDDAANYSSRSTPVKVTLDDLANDGATGEGDNVRSDVDTVSGGDAGDTLTGDGDYDVLNGNGGGDTLNGGGGTDYLYGGEGNDAVNGGAGDDTLFPIGGTDMVSGGFGIDTVSYFNQYDETVAVVASLDGNANDGPPGENDNLRIDVENLTGGAGGDTLTGNSVENRIEGVGGADTLNGGVGNDDLLGDFPYFSSGGGADTLNGGAGDDVLNGGAGGDVLNGGPDSDAVSYGDRSAAVTASLDGAPGDGQTGENDDVGTDVETLIGSPLGDTLRGNDAANTLLGGAGTDQLFGNGGDDLLGGDETNPYAVAADVIEGGIGNDTVTYAIRFSPVTADLDGVADDGQPGENDRIKTDVENLVGGDAGDTLTGNGEGNALFGGTGFGIDVLSGGLGEDFLAGGRGQDTHTGGGGDDRIDSHGDDQADTDTCGADVDQVIADPVDLVDPDCEAVTTAAAAASGRAESIRRATRAARRLAAAYSLR